MEPFAKRFNLFFMIIVVFMVKYIRLDNSFFAKN